jgi:hypothetical protein
MSNDLVAPRAADLVTATQEPAPFARITCLLCAAPTVRTYISQARAYARNADAR